MAISPAGEVYLPAKLVFLCFTGNKKGTALLEKSLGLFELFSLEPVEFQQVLLGLSYDGGRLTVIGAADMRHITVVVPGVVGAKLGIDRVVPFPMFMRKCS